MRPTIALAALKTAISAVRTTDRAMVLCFDGILTLPFHTQMDMSSDANCATVNRLLGETVNMATGHHRRDFNTFVMTRVCFAARR